MSSVAPAFEVFDSVLHKCRLYFTVLGAAAPRKLSSECVESQQDCQLIVGGCRGCFAVHLKGPPSCASGSSMEDSEPALPDFDEDSLDQ
eukprot:3833312-Amphidinium_carterae.1